MNKSIWRGKHGPLLIAEIGGNHEGDFEYAKKLTAVNAINLASIAWAPPAVTELSIGGIVEASAKFRWSKANSSDIKGYRIYWRDTTSPTWDLSLIHI